MSNPVLNESAIFKRADKTADDATMTISGTMNAIAVLFGLSGIAAVLSWNATSVESFPAWLPLAGIGGMVIAIVLAFRMRWAMYLGPVYALVQGAFVGAISKVYDAAYDGIVLQAALGTATVFVVMWALWSSRIIKVTARFRMIVVAATLSIFVLYLGAFIVNFFTPVSFLSSASGLSIGISVLVIGVAALNLALDFDLIERGIAGKGPKYLEWYAAFGLLVTVIWLYLEILRLLSKLQRR